MQHLTPIEDCMESKCPLYWDLLAGPTLGTIVKARRCPNCVKYALNCQSPAQMEICCDNGWLDRHASNSFMHRGSEESIAYPARRPPRADEDWTFEKWYFGSIAREVACYLLEQEPIGAFLVRHSQIQVFLRHFLRKRGAML